jgi:hypothetical protein
LEKLGEAGKLERGELDASWKLDAEPIGELETVRRAGKICKILHKLEIHTSQVYV